MRRKQLKSGEAFGRPASRRAAGRLPGNSVAGLHLRPGIVLLAFWVSLGPAAGQAQDRPAPHYDYRERAQPYGGPGREDADLADLQEVLLGYFGPADPQEPEHGDLWVAAEMAVSEVNAAGGCSGLPLRLVPAWSENPWGTGISRVAQMVYTDPILAFIGSVDGPSTHLVEQVVAKARIPLVNPAATDRTANLAGVPWMFTCLPGEQDLLEPLISSLLERTGTGRFIVVAALDHDSRIFAGELRRLLSRRGAAPAYVIEVDPGGSIGMLDRLERPDLQAVVLVAGPGHSASLLRQIRSVYSGPVYGSPALGRRQFLEAVREFAGELLFPYPADSSAVDRFSVAHLASTGRRLDFAAAQTYDAVRLLCEAVTRAGFNRARIHDALWDLSPWPGPAAGPIQWDRTGQNTRPVTLVTLQCSPTTGCRIERISDTASSRD